MSLVSNSLLHQHLLETPLLTELSGLYNTTIHLFLDPYIIASILYSEYLRKKKNNTMVFVVLGLYY